MKDGGVWRNFGREWTYKYLDMEFIVCLLFVSFVLHDATSKHESQAGNPCWHPLPVLYTLSPPYQQNIQAGGRRRLWHPLFYGWAFFGTVSLWSWGQKDLWSRTFRSVLRISWTEITKTAWRARMFLLRKDLLGHECRGAYPNLIWILQLRMRLFLARTRSFSHSSRCMVLMKSSPEGTKKRWKLWSRMNRGLCYRAVGAGQ